MVLNPLHLECSKQIMESNRSLTNMRAHYRYGELLESEVDANPVVQFNRWMNEAVLDNLFEPNALSLATADNGGQPSCRTVLLKGVLEEGFIFYTNYESRKGQELKENSKAAMLFWWREHERQVRIEGEVGKIPGELSSDYFNERPRGSRISAIISPQSEILESREQLEELYINEEKKLAGSEPVCPSYWGGFILKPNLFEFWQGRPNRLHDRLQYSRNGEHWKIERLAP
jgi:pyridoxamine 5'-phosphate oxidase